MPCFTEMENDTPASEKPLVDDDNEEERKATVMVKAANLSNKVRRRMSGRLASQLRGVKLRTTETVERLNFTVDLVTCLSDTDLVVDLAVAFAA